MKNIQILVFFCAAVLLILSSCGWLFDNEPDNESDNDNTIYASEFRGEWIRMDTGERWYINGNSISVNGFNSNINVQLVRVSDNVATAVDYKNQKYTLFAARLANAGFRARVVFPDEIKTANNIVYGAGRSSQGTTGQKPPVKITNPSQPDQQIEAKPDEETGDIIVTGVIPGDTIEIKPDDSQWGDVKIEVTPGYGDDQDMGIIPLANGANHKVTVRMADPADDIFNLYADDVACKYIIKIENVGSANSTGASYSIDWDKDDFDFVSGNIKGILNTIEPGMIKEIPLTLRSKPIDSVNKIKEIKLQIVHVDTAASVIRTWDDTVSINYYRQSIPIYIRSQNPVQGVIRTPKSETLYFKTTGSGNNFSCALNVPWSKEDYIVAFLGADVNSETVYSFGVGEMPPGDWSSIVDNNEQYKYLGVCENEKTAPELNLKNKRTFMYYLYNTAVQYFRIKMGDEPPEFGNDILITASTASQWEDALSTVKNGGDGLSSITPKVYNIRINGNIYVPGTYDFSFGSVWDVVIKLTGSGTLSLNSGGSILIVGEKQKLIIDDDNLTLKGFNPNNGAVIDVQKNGSLELAKGIITGNIEMSAVIVNEDGFFIMSGGEISGNTADYGGGVYVRGTFMMTGGNITGNSALDNDVFGGGGVFVSDNGIFTMSGGNISGNSAALFGGGVYVNGVNCTFFMLGGTISGNSADFGGGVFISLGNFHKTGGIIFGVDEGNNSNKAKHGCSAIYMYDENSGDNWYRDSTLTENDKISTENDTGWEKV